MLIIITPYSVIDIPTIVIVWLKIQNFVAELVGRLLSEICDALRQLELQIKVVLVSFADCFCQGTAFHDTLIEYQWSKINLIKPKRTMNEVNVKFSIKSFASSIDQLEQQCYVVGAVILKERGICVRP